MSKIGIPITQTITEGDIFTTVKIIGTLKVGQEVDIVRSFAMRIGKPIAKGECIGCMGDEPANGRSANTMKALKHYYKVRVTRIF